MKKLTKKLMKEIGITKIEIDTNPFGIYIMKVYWCDGKVEQYNPIKTLKEAE